MGELKEKWKRGFKFWTEKKERVQVWVSNWVSFLAYPNLFGFKGFVVVVKSSSLDWCGERENKLLGVPRGQIIWPSYNLYGFWMGEWKENNQDGLSFGLNKEKKNEVWGWCGERKWSPW
jgi:hypothetical protein